LIVFGVAKKAGKSAKRRHPQANPKPFQGLFEDAFCSQGYINCNASNIQDALLCSQLKATTNGVLRPASLNSLHVAFEMIGLMGSDTAA
jgi:hypothetical protein